MKGLGDVVAKVTEVTGIAAAVKAIVGDDCGCAARRERMNAMFPFQTGKDQYYTEKIKDGNNTSLDSGRR
jgi:hypothetical protein